MLLVEKLDRSIKTTKEDVKKMVDHVATACTGPIPGIATSGIPLNPERKNYKYCRFWNEAPWQAIRSKQGPKPLDLDSPIISMFLEDEFGQPVSHETKKRLFGDLNSYWTGMLDAGHTPKNWTDSLDLKTKNDFRRSFEGQYPFLRLCEGGWKVDQLWINYFRIWRRGHPALITPEQTITRKLSPATKKPATDPYTNEPTPDPPIFHPSDIGSANTSTGFKRSREDQEYPDTSKRHKGKAKEIPGLTPVHPRPQLRKISATFAKVSIPHIHSSNRN